MIYREKFLENIVRFEDEALRVYEAAQSLLVAPHFAELLKVRPSSPSSSRLTCASP